MPQGLRRRKRGGPRTPAYLGEEQRAGNEERGGQKKRCEGKEKEQRRQAEKQKEGWGLPDENRSGGKSGKRNPSLGHAREEKMA